MPVVLCAGVGRCFKVPVVLCAGVDSCFKVPVVLFVQELAGVLRCL